MSCDFSSCFFLRMLYGVTEVSSGACVIEK